MSAWLTMLPSNLKKKDTFDLTSARVFLEKTEFHKRLVEFRKEFYLNRIVEGENVKVYTMIFSIIKSVANLQISWRKKAFLSNAEVSCVDQATKQLGTS